MWDLPGPGLKSVSPALAGRFLTTAPPGKSLNMYFYLFIYFRLCWVFVAAHRLSLVASSGGLLFVVVCRLLLAVASLVAEHGL